MRLAAYAPFLRRLTPCSSCPYALSFRALYLAEPGFREELFSDSRSIEVVRSLSLVRRKLFSLSVSPGLLTTQVVPLVAGLRPAGRGDHRPALHVVTPTLVELFERVALLVAQRGYQALK